MSSDFAEAQDLPLVTQDGHALNAEAILALDPTVIITDTSLGPWDVVLQMRDAGHPGGRRRLAPRPRQRRRADPRGRRPARRAGGRRRARGPHPAARSTRSPPEIAEVAPADPGDRLRTVFLYVRGQSGVYYMFGEGSGAESLIEAIGGYDVADEIGWHGMKPLTDEGLVAAQPDVVLMMTDGLESVGGVDGLLERLPALAETPAGQHRRFVDMDDAQILGFGADHRQVLNALAVATYAPDGVSDRVTATVVDRQRPVIRRGRRSDRPARRAERRAARRRWCRGRARPARRTAVRGARLAAAQDRARHRADAAPPAGREHPLAGPLPARRDGRPRRRRLATAGALMQGVFGNPLAEPGIVGVSAGAAVAAATVIVFELTFAGTWTVAICAFVGGLLTTLAGLRDLARRRPHRGGHAGAHRHRGQRDDRRRRWRS